MGEQSLKEKTSRGLFWGGMSNGIQQLVGMLFGIYLARILNAEDYGLVGMLAVFSGIGGVLINSGFSSALTNKRNVTHKDYNAVFWFSFFVGLVCYVILYLLAPLIAQFYNRPELVKLSRVIFISFLFSGSTTVSYTILFKQLMVKQQSFIDVVAMLLSGTVGILLAMLGYGYWALALQSIIYVVAGAILRFIIVPWKPTLDIDFRPLKSMFSFSSKLFFTNIFQQLNANIFTILLGRLYNAKQLGDYMQGQKWAGFGNIMIVGMMNSVAQPVLVSVINEQERQKNVFRKMLRFGAFVAFPSFLGLAFVGREFIQITLGAKWLPSLPFLQLFCLWGLIAFIWNLYQNLLMSHGKSNIILWGTIGVGLLQILFVLILSSFGIIFMVISYIAVYYIGILFFHYYVSHLIQYSIFEFLLDIGGYFIISIASIFVIYFSTIWIDNVYCLLIFKILGVAVLYIAILYLLGSKILLEVLHLINKKIEKYK